MKDDDRIARQTEEWLEGDHWTNRVRPLADYALAAIRRGRNTTQRDDDRVSTAVRFHKDLHAQLVAAAAERDVPVNWLVVKAVEELLANLLPVDEFRLTRKKYRV